MTDAKLTRKERGRLERVERRMDTLRARIKGGPEKVVNDCHAELVALEWLRDTALRAAPRAPIRVSTWAAPCRHEWYQGVCVHCKLPAAEFRSALRAQEGVVVPREMLENVRRALERGLSAAAKRQDSEAVDTFQHSLDNIQAMLAAASGEGT
jgi:hypothetical protein